MVPIQHWLAGNPTTTQLLYSNRCLIPALSATEIAEAVLWQRSKVATSCQLVQTCSHTSISNYKQQCNSLQTNLETQHQDSRKVTEKSPRAQEVTEPSSRPLKLSEQDRACYSSTKTKWLYILLVLRWLDTVVSLPFLAFLIGVLPTFS